MKDKSIETVSEKILLSYKTRGGTNNNPDRALPTRKKISEIIILFEKIFFPGFRKEEKKDYRSDETVLRNNLEKLSCLLHKEISKSGLNIAKEKADQTVTNLIEKIPELRENLLLDVQSALKGDPAARSEEEIILSYPGVKAIMAYRIAHEIFVEDIPLIPRMISEEIHGKTGIDIHPGATIGKNFFIDHGTGVVIGETTVIGNNVKIYQGVTLGALSVKKEEALVKRHPTIGNDVTIYAGATILGGETIVGDGSVIGGNVWLTSSVETNSLVYNRNADYIIKNRYAQTLCD